jgi:hypothetical protein
MAVTVGGKMTLRFSLLEGVGWVRQGFSKLQGLAG